MRNVKITAAQIIALRSATMRDNGSYELTTAKGQTITALIRVGVVVDGTRSLTVQGVSVMHSVSHIDVIASKGHMVSVSDDVDSLALFTLPTVTEIPAVDPDVIRADAAEMIISDDAAELSTMITETLSGVIITGDEPNTWAPDFTASSASECYFGCGVAPVAVFVDYVGRTEGVCASHRSRVEGNTYDVPGAAEMSYNVPSHTRYPNGRSGADDTNALSETFAPGTRVISNATGAKGTVIQPYMTGVIASINARMSAVTLEMDNGSKQSALIGDLSLMSEENGEIFLDITPGRHALDMGSNSYNRFVGIGISEDGRAFTFGLATAISAHPGMNGTGKVNIPVTFGEVIRINGTRYTITDNRYGVNNDGARKGDPLLIPVVDAATDDETDAGFTETLVTKEYELSVIVDDVTGTRVSLGWVTLTMNAAQCMDWDRVAEEYGRTQNTRTPRHGWASIITVHNVADI